MTALPEHMTPERWLFHLLSARAAREGGVLRRKLRDVERIVGRDAFLHELRRRGYRAAVNGDQIVIFCNRAPVHLVE